MQSDGAFSAPRYSGMLDCLRQSVKEEGLSVLTRGLNSTVLRAFPTNAATFFVVTTLTSHFSKYESTNEPMDDIRELLQVDRVIEKVAAISQNVYQFQEKILKKLRENHLANYLPVILSQTQESIQQLTANIDPILHCQGDGLDADTHQALTAFLKANNQKASTTTPENSGRWFSRRGVVTQVDDSTKSIMINKELVSSK